MVRALAIVALGFLVGSRSHAVVAKIVTLNLYNRPASRGARLANAAAALRATAPDIIVLQEVGSGLLAGTSALDRLQAEFPQEAGWRWASHWQETNLGLWRNGLAIASRFPLENSAYTELPQSTAWDLKGFQRAAVRVGHATLDLVNVHLRSTRSETVKEAELDTLAGSVAGGPEGTHWRVVAGDFNWEWEHPLTRAFRHRLGAASALGGLLSPEITATWTPESDGPCDERVPGEPHQLIDDILVVALRGSARVLDPGIQVGRRLPRASDHCAVFASVELVAPPIALTRQVR